MTQVKQIDKIVELEAQIAGLKAAQKSLIEDFKKAGAGKYKGNNGILTVSVAERKTLDMKAVRQKLSPQFISAHTKKQEVVSARITIRA